MALQLASRALQLIWDETCFATTSCGLTRNRRIAEVQAPLGLWSGRNTTRKARLHCVGNVWKSPKPSMWRSGEGESPMGFWPVQEGSCASSGSRTVTRGVWADAAGKMAGGKHSFIERSAEVAEKTPALEMAPIPPFMDRNPVGPLAL